MGTSPHKYVDSRENRKGPMALPMPTIIIGVFAECLGLRRNSAGLRSTWMRSTWQGVFPASTTQFQPDQALDIPATLTHLDRMIEVGIHGLIMLGKVGENC